MKIIVKMYVEAKSKDTGISRLQEVKAYLFV